MSFTLRPRLIALTALIAASAFGCGTAKPEPDANESTRWIPPAIPVGDSPVRGPVEAPVRIVEFSDFQCPYSARVQSTLDELAAAYPTNVAFVFKHLPLRMHEQARGAAIAAAYAADAGQFWAYRQKLFANQRALDEEQLAEYAAAIGLDAAQVRQAQKSLVYKAQIYADMALAAKWGATATPMFFVNGRLIRGAQSADTFREVIDQELEKADGLRRAGVPAAQLADVLTAQNIASGLAADSAKRGRPAKAAPAAPEDDGVIYPVNASGEHGALGASEADALVTIVVFTDYQCPYCARLDATLREIIEKYQGQLRVVIRNLPLEMHRDARAAAEAALAAGDQGQWAAMHRRLLAHPREQKPGDLARYALELGLEPTRFAAALDEHRFEAVIDADLLDAKKLGIRSTPSSFVNGRKVVGAKDSAAFSRIIDEELARAEGIRAKKGLSGRALYRALVGMPES